MPHALLTTRYRACLVGLGDKPIVGVLGGISATRDARAWWPAIVGDDCPVDTREFRVLGVDWLDGGARADGRPERTITTHDQARFLGEALDEFGIDRLHTLIGASYGGMVGLAFAERYPDRVEQLVIISAPANAHPMSTALRSIQRRIVELGLETGRAHDALAIARGLAMTSYRSASEFAERFADGVDDAGRFVVDSYLRHEGEKFAHSFTAARFLSLSLSADLHRVDASAICTPAVFVAAPGDTIVPFEQMAHLAAQWGGPNRLVETPTRTGHDAFLAEPHAVGGILHDLLTSQVLA